MVKHRKYSAGLPVMVAAVCASSMSLSSAMADDTEVFFGQVDPDLNVSPNVMFVLDTSGSMGGFDGTSLTRMERMKNAMEIILDGTTNVNVGIMNFNGTNGGGAVLYPVTPIDQIICTGAECGEQIAAPRVNSGGADIEMRISDGDMMLGGNVLSLGESERGAELVGLQFGRFDVPQGAQITSAWLEFTSVDDNSADADLQIEGELAAMTAPFTNTDNDAANRVKTTVPPVAWKPKPWKTNIDYQSPDISAVIQEIVDQTDWCGGNPISLFVSGTGTRNAISFDNSPTYAPKLSFSYDASAIPVGGGCANKTTVASVKKSSDDAEEKSYGGEVKTGSSDLELPYDGSTQQISGIRFDDIKIPKNSVITGATIEFEVDRQRWGSVDLKIAAQAADDPATFSAKWRNISNRPTTAWLDWLDVPNPPQNAKLVTRDLTPLVQTLVDRPGWQQGNAMVFLIAKHSGGDGRREVETIDGESHNAPKIRINYQSVNDGSAPVVITARDQMKEVVNGFREVGGTPIVDAYYEAARYFRGDAVDYGRQRGQSGYRHYRVSVPESYTGGSVYRQSACTDNDLSNPYCWDEKINGNPVYKAPIKSSCQSNHIVFLSDGAATSNSSADKVKALTGGDCASTADPDDYCGAELAAWLHTNDQSSTLPETQKISTYTVGFNINSSFLRSLATSGGGEYHEAESAADLVGVFEDILGDVATTETSFVAPGATVNQFNRLTHRNDIYFALFKPDPRPTWSGNLKRYEVGTGKDGEITINDSEGNPAVDPTSGFFHESSRSWWLEDSDENDGNIVSAGGAAMQLDFTNMARRIFTYTGDYAAIPAAGVDLRATAQSLHEDNSSITLEMMGLENKPGDMDAYRDELLKWARGMDRRDVDDDGDFTDWRMHMGDPMHARPVILNYDSPNGTETAVFVGTNEGYLHAFERDGGTEIYSFVPKDFLPNFDTFWNNQSSDSHPYGMDGTLSVWTTDINENVTIDAGEEAMLYTGLRRGGSSYFAFNVASRTDPKLAWVIEAGTPGFEELGQTWSKMAPTKIRFNGADRDVLIFGAGYDETQDLTMDATNARLPRVTATKGRGIYIVDARTGTLLYSALGVAGGSQQFADMNYSMPGDLRILDADFDGFADQIYGSDTGGQVWRFDLTQYHDSGDLLKGGVIADLSGPGPKNERRFYYEPDVAIISNNGDRFLAISIGSGWRAHPLDRDIDDRFYMIKSADLFSAPACYGKSTDNCVTSTPITEADLIDVTNDIDPDSNQYGWMYDLGAPGEKVLGSSVTVNNQVIFTSFRPELAVGDCSTAIGGGSVYALNILTGGPAVDMNGDGVLDEEDREKQLAHGGIPPEPAVLITEDGPTLLAGPEQPFSPKFDNLTRRTFWVDKGDEE